MKMAFFINPAAGSGFFLNQKDSKSDYISKQKSPVAIEAGNAFLKQLDPSKLEIVTPKGIMGSRSLEHNGLKPVMEIEVAMDNTTVDDTVKFIKSINRMNVELLVFVGGDGTAKDILEIIDRKIPVLGVPSGLKMYSGIFAITPQRAAAVVDAFSSGSAQVEPSDILDLDRDGKIKQYGTLLKPSSEWVVPSGKTEYLASDPSDIIDYIFDYLDDDCTYIIGTGGTCKKIMLRMGIESDPLAIDIVRRRKLIKSDASEDDLLALSDRCIKIIISPLGGQNFLLGHGNRQITKRVLEKVGFSNIIIISAPEKIEYTDRLFIDVGNAELPGYVKVLTGYGKYRMMKIVQ